MRVLTGVSYSWTHIVLIGDSIAVAIKLTIDAAIEVIVVAVIAGFASVDAPVTANHIAAAHQIFDTRAKRLPPKLFATAADVAARTTKAFDQGVLVAVPAGKIAPVHPHVREISVGEITFAKKITSMHPSTGQVGASKVARHVSSVEFAAAQIGVGKVCPLGVAQGLTVGIGLSTNSGVLIGVSDAPTVVYVVGNTIAIAVAQAVDAAIVGISVAVIAFFFVLNDTITATAQAAGVVAVVVVVLVAIVAVFDALMNDSIAAASLLTGVTTGIGIDAVGIVAVFDTCIDMPITALGAHTVVEAGIGLVLVLVITVFNTYLYMTIAALGAYTTV